jgi:hypothetical protein
VSRCESAASYAATKFTRLSKRLQSAPSESFVVRSSQDTREPTIAAGNLPGARALVCHQLAVIERRVRALSTSDSVWYRKAVVCGAGKPVEASLQSYTRNSAIEQVV